MGSLCAVAPTPAAIIAQIIRAQIAILRSPTIAEVDYATIRLLDQAITHVHDARVPGVCRG